MKTMFKNNDLTQGKIWKVILNFTLPIFLGTLFQSLYTTIDAIIVGKFAGKDAFAAIESVMSFQRLPVSFFIGLSSGATISISQYFGAKEKEDVSKASHTAMLFAIVGGLILSILSCILSPYFIGLIKVPQKIFHEAYIYTFICFSGMVFSMIYNIGSGILRALGNSKTPFHILIFANILNIVLDLIFVINFNLSVVGVGLATLISQIVSAILVFVVLMRTNLDCRIYIKNQDEVKEYEVDLDITQADIKGDYTITIGEDNKTVPVTYSNGKLNYGSEVTPLYDEEILNLVVQREFFTSLDVKETFKSAETELREIVYQPENNSDLYKHLKSKYDLPEETTCIVLVNHSSSTIYRVTIQLKSNQKIVQISSVIFEKE